MHFQWQFAACVAAAHVVAILYLTNAPVHLPSESASRLETPATVVFIAEQGVPDVEPLSEVALARLRINLRSITMIRFESADWGDIARVLAPASAPTLSRFQTVDAAAFAQRAGLRSGEAASVILTVEVLPDGTAGRVEVLRGCGDPAVDAEAVAYGRLLRWVPGTENHRAQAMRINVPVTLAWDASTGV